MLDVVPLVDVVPLALRGREAAKALGVSERTLARLKAEGKLPFVRVGSAILFPVADLLAYLERSKEVTKTTLDA